MQHTFTLYSCYATDFPTNDYAPLDTLPDDYATIVSQHQFIQKSTLNLQNHLQLAQKWLED